MNIESIQEILSLTYGWENAKIKPLVGYETLNYRVKHNNNTYVLKVYPYNNETLEIIRGESHMQKTLQGLDCQYPFPITNLEGNDISTWQDTYIIRCLSFLEGTFLAEVQHSKALVASFGRTMATLNIKLKDEYFPAIKAKRLSWDLSNTIWSRQSLDSITPANNRSLVDYFMLQFESKTHSIAHTLPHQIIHNDANDWNVLCMHDKVSGIIDFGDAVYSTRISEIAVALSYLIVGKEDPISIASQFLNAYHEINPIQKDELDVLYYYIAARMCVSLISSAKSRLENPENKYISISEKGFWSLMRTWIIINPKDASNGFRKACNYSTAKNANIDVLLSQRAASIPSALSISYTQPIHMESAAFQYMYGSDGTTYLDAYNNIPHVGHEHPRVVAAAQDQIAKLNTNTRYLFDPLQEYSEKLLSKFPDHLDQVFLVNSGSAASDLAIRLARNYTERDQLIVMEHGYHGNTQQGIAISHYKYASKGGRGKINSIIEAPFPNSYIDGFDNDNQTTGSRYCRQLLTDIQDNNNIAAFIAEPISGCGGQVPLPHSYLQELYTYFQSNGIIKISDEVQTGFGRLGSHYWGFEMHGIAPDIVILGKPIGNGHPMAAVVTTKAIADSFDNGMEFFSSFGGNPVSCRIGSEVLDIIEEENLQKNAHNVGLHFKNRMQYLMKNYPVIGDVRGSGLFLGIEIITPHSFTYKPNTDLAKFIKNQLRQKNILVSTDGPFDNVIKMKPPLCFTCDDMDIVIDALEFILKNN